MFNPVSYFLWTLLSLVCAAALIRAKQGGYALIIGYFFSDLFIGTYAYIKGGKASFKAFEWFIVFLTLVCAVIYLICERQKKDAANAFRPSVIVNGIAAIIAGIPFLVDSFRDPHSSNLPICLMYLLISFLGYYGEETFNGQFIPKLSIVYWGIIIGGILISYV